ncbi:MULTISPECIES: hypothetical protein [unclassified Pseudomonas]|uniref:hypothetical protein n=1 Tax=unclassified Pseudomonas TaxID=196821 RepID=UPI00047FB074|nr:MULTISPECIES: hypothetical protein [unclassified Pseudomonas]
MKINHELAVAAAAGRSLGIPMIAGCPLAKDLIELGSCNRFFWVDLAKVKPSDLGFDMVIDNPLADETQDKSFVIDNLDEVLRIVEAESNLIGFDTFLESMKVIGMASRGRGAYHPLAFMGGYKAVYLLLTDVQRSGRF